jgi:hypothetical protein
MLALLLAALVALPAQGPASVPTVGLTPRVVAEIDLTSLKGRLLRQLAWSPDGSQLYLQTYTANSDASVKEVFHYVIAATGGALARVEAEPDWAHAYWAWKSAQGSPDDPTFRIELETLDQVSTATSVPMAGDLSSGAIGSAQGVSVAAATNAARQSEHQMVYRMRLNGEIVGEWVNHPIMPGLTFGWGPSRSGLIAYAEKESGRLIIMNRQGGKERIDATKGVTLPAWTADGGQMAYLESRGRTKFALIVAAVGR